MNVLSVLYLEYVSIASDAEHAELWAAKLAARRPAAAHTLLRQAAAAAFRRRDFATCDRLTASAEALGEVG